MNKVYRYTVSTVASWAAFTTAAMAGAIGYTPDPVIEDNGSDAGVFLLLAVAALLVIRAAATPKPAEPVETAPETTE